MSVLLSFMFFIMSAAKLNIARALFKKAFDEYKTTKTQCNFVLIAINRNVMK